MVSRHWLLVAALCVAGLGGNPGNCTTNTLSFPLLRQHAPMAVLSAMENRVMVLDAPPEPSLLPTWPCDVDEYKRYYRQAKVYVLGTMHCRERSIADASELVRTIRPDALVLEIDQPPLSGFKGWCLQRVPNEWWAAYDASKELPHCVVVPGDRPHGVTLKRIGHRGLWECVSMMVSGEIRRAMKEVSETFKRDPFVEKSEREENVRRHNQIVSSAAPQLWRALMTERDLCLTYSLKKALDERVLSQFAAFRSEKGAPEPVKVLAVVGAAHTEGIKAHMSEEIDAQLIESLHR